MKRLLIVSLTLIFGILLVNSQALEKSLLWKISGNDLEAPSYLYGTFHLLCPDDLVFSDETKKAVQQSEQLILELDFDDPEMMASMQKGIVFTDGTTAKDYLSEEDYKLVADFFSSKLGMPFEALGAIKPFYLSAMTMLFFLDCQPGSPEQEFAKLAEEQGIEVIGLETVGEQLSFIDDIPLEDAAMMLVEGIEEQEEGVEMTAEMVSTYLAGDLEGIQEIMDKYMEDEYADFNESFLTARNQVWVPKIKDMIAENSSFVAVGAGHLTGKTGLIKLLRKEGYTVEAVK